MFSNVDLQNFTNNILIKTNNKNAVVKGILGDNLKMRESLAASKSDIITKKILFVVDSGEYFTALTECSST